MKYQVINEYWPDEEILVEMKKTDKTVTITPISPKPKCTHSCIDELWDNGKIVIREPKSNGHIKMTRHLLKDWGDGEYTLYPNRDGVPFFMKPVESRNDNSN